MAIKSGFHNSINGDRKYNAEDMNRPYKDIVSNGVFPNPSSQLQVFASNGMTVSVSAGGGLFGNGWVYNDTPLLLTLAPPEPTLSRCDAIVVRRDESEEVRDTVITVKKGTPSTNPKAPMVTRGDQVYEYCLATILIAPGTSVITNSLITDTRPDKTVCGWVTGLIDQVDTTTLFNQWQSAYEEQYEKFMDEFEIWWEGVQNVLANDESASAEILRLRQEKADKIQFLVGILENEWRLADDGYYYFTYNDYLDTQIKADSLIIVGPAENPLEKTINDYFLSGVICIEQGDGYLKFRSNIPKTVSAKVINMGV